MNDFDQTKATSQSGQRIAAEILVEPQDEVSTLGDPMFAPGGMLIGSLEKDEVTARYVFMFNVKLPHLLLNQFEYLLE